MIDSGQVSVGDSKSAGDPVEAIDPAKLGSLQEGIASVKEKLGRVIRGKDDVIDLVLISILSRGSVLLEDVPGVGKTTLAKSLAALIDLDFQRIQCTPDLLPADILGGSIYQPATGEFEFRAGPIFCNLLIADEINRASPRTQSALLEAMAESQVTIDGNRYDLKQPFLVIATQNPLGSEGTFPLPESQLDRFLMRLTMDYPDAESEVDLLLDDQDDETEVEIESALRRDELIEFQRLIRSVHVDRKVAMYMVRISAASRQSTHLKIGSSPRGSKMLLHAAQAKAALAGRGFVLPDDIRSLAVPVLSHRVSHRSFSADRSEVETAIEQIVSQVEVPV